jgi:hypothetical protein
VTSRLRVTHGTAALALDALEDDDEDNDEEELDEWEHVVPLVSGSETAREDDDMDMIIVGDLELDLELDVEDDVDGVRAGLEALSLDSVAGRNAAAKSGKSGKIGKKQGASGVAGRLEGLSYAAALTRMR